MYQHDFSDPDQNDEDLRRFDRFESPRSDRECHQQQIKIRRFHHEIRKILHPCRLLQRIGPGGIAAIGPSLYDRRTVAMEDLDLQSSDFPGHLLSVCSGHLDPADLLRGDRRCQPSRHPDQGFQLSGKSLQDEVCRTRQDRDCDHGDLRSDDDP